MSDILCKELYENNGGSGLDTKKNISLWEAG